MRGNPVKGAGYLLRGFSMLTQPGIRQFVLVPMLINILLFSGAIWLLINEFDRWVEYWMSQLPTWLSFLDFLLWPLFALLVLIVVYYGFSIVANLVAAPFNGFLSEKVELQQRGVRIADDGWKGLLTMVPRALARELSKLAYYLPRLLALLVISLIPGVNLLSPLLWFVFGAWMMAIQYCDYPMDNNKVTFRHMKELLAERNLTSLSFGAIVQMGMLIPVVNLIMMPAAVIGATLYWCEDQAQRAGC